MGKIKAVFFDIDNTLLSHTLHRIPESAGRALDELEKRGILRAVATGRHILQLEALPDVPNYAFDGYIVLEGQLCLDRNMEKVCSFPLQGGALEEVIGLFEKKEESVFLFEKDRIYVNTLTDRIRGMLAASASRFPETAPYDGGEILMASLFVSAEQERKIAAKMPHCKWMRWNDAGVDVIDSSGGKVAGIRCFIEERGIREDEIMAFGDGENDIDMLKMAAIGVAMGNAPDSVKRAADYVTDRIDDDGVFNALRHFGVI